MPVAQRVMQESRSVNDFKLRKGTEPSPEVIKIESKMLNFFSLLKIGDETELIWPFLRTHLITLKTSNKNNKTSDNLVENTKASEEVLGLLETKLNELFFVYNLHTKIDSCPNQPIFVCMKVDEIAFIKEFSKKNQNDRLSPIRIGMLTFFYWETSIKEVNSKLVYRIYLFKFVARSLIDTPNGDITSISQHMEAIEGSVSNLVKNNTKFDSTSEDEFLAKSIALKNTLYYHQGAESTIWSFVSDLSTGKETPSPCITNRIVAILEDGLAFRTQELSFRRKILAQSYSNSEEFGLNDLSEKIFDKEIIFKDLVGYIASYCCIVREESVIADNSSELYFRPFVQTELLELFDVRPYKVLEFFRQLYFGLYLYLLTSGKIEGKWGELKINGYELKVYPSDNLTIQISDTISSKLYIPSNSEELELKAILG